MAAFITVLLSVAAASIAFAIARQTSMVTRATATRVDSEQARSQAELVLSSVEAQLQANPAGYLTAVLPDELARICLAGPQAGSTFKAGEAFPTACGPYWTYDDTQTAPSGTGIKVTPPTPSDPVLRVKVLAKAATLDAGIEATYNMDGARRWVWASTGSMPLSSTGQSTSVRIEGAAYAASGVAGPVASGVAIAAGTAGIAGNKAVIATDGTVSGITSLSTASLYSASPDAAAAVPRLDVRNLQRSTLSPGSLASNASFLRDVGCPGGTPAAAANFSGAGAETAAVASTSTHLCLRAGGQVVSDTGQAVVVPAGITGYLVITDSPSVGHVTVYSTTKTVDLSDSSALLCSPRPTCTASLMNAGSHPGQLAFWTSGGSQLLGSFFLPVSGVIATDADVYLGVCSTGANEYATTTACAKLSGTQPGMAISSPLTIVAGSLQDPKNVVVGTSIVSGGSGQLGAVATAKVVLPYWMQPAGSTATLSAHLVGAGIRLDPAASSITSFPSSPASSDRASTLTVNGSFTGVNLPLGAGTAAAVVYKLAATPSTSPPWFAATDATWAKASLLRFAGVDACGKRQCDTWTGTEAPAATAPAGSTTPTTAPANLPDPPTDVVATPIWNGTSAASVTFTAPASAGSAPIDNYRVTCSSSSGGSTITAQANDTTIVVSNLTKRSQYSCTVAAHTTVGWSAESAPSATFDSLGPPDAPTNVVAVPSWDSTAKTSNASVSFSAPANNGGLTIGSYAVSCSSSDGGTTVTSSGAASPLPVTALTSYKNYTCTVTATNVAGTSPASSPSNEFLAIAPPSKPLNVTGVPAYQQVAVTWNPPAQTGGSIVEYQVERSVDGGTTWTNTASAGTALSYNATVLTNSTSYWFHVRARNAVDWGDWSDPSASVATPGPPSQPTAAPACSSNSNAQVPVSWTYTASNNGSTVTGFNLRYAVSGTSTWTLVSSPATSTQGSVTSYPQTGLTNGTTYVFQYRAVNSVGTSPWSASSAGCTPGKAPDVPATVVCAMGATSGEIIAGYTPSVANGSAVTKYTISYALSSGGTVLTVDNTSNFTPGYDGGIWTSITGLTNKSAYHVKVQATNAVGSSATSAWSSDCTPQPDIPLPPTIEAAANTPSPDLGCSYSKEAGKAATGWCSWQWDTPTNATSFNVSYGGINRGSVVRDPASSGSNTWIYPGLPYGCQHIDGNPFYSGCGPLGGSASSDIDVNYIQVQACNVRGCSAAAEAYGIAAQQPAAPVVAVFATQVGSAGSDVATFSMKAAWADSYEIMYYQGKNGNVVCGAFGAPKTCTDGWYADESGKNPADTPWTSAWRSAASRSVHLWGGTFGSDGWSGSTEYFSPQRAGSLKSVDNITMYTKVHIAGTNQYHCYPGGSGTPPDEATCNYMKGWVSVQ